jgi:predicted Fe-S protein YdhL (DUF1289 family)
MTNDEQSSPSGDNFGGDIVQSPCIRVCIVDGASGLCLGCLRTLAEIAEWSTLSPERRREIMAELPARTARIDPARRLTP